MYEKILVPIDGSKHASRALNNAVQIAKKFNGKISLINVCEVEEALSIFSPTRAPIEGVEAAGPVSERGARLKPTTYSDVVDCMLEAGKKILEDGEKKVKAEGVPVATLAKQGNVIEEILKAAKEGKFDVIIMGSRGLSGINQLALGSVSDAVMRHSPCPVLVVK